MDTKAITDFILASKIPKDKKDYVIKFIGDYAIYRDKLSPEKRITEDARISNIIMSAVEAYKDEIDRGKLSVMLKDAFNKSVTDILEPARNIKDSLFFLTRPYILIPITVVVVVLYFYGKNIVARLLR